jgi:hypothetical protein
MVVLLGQGTDDAKRLVEVAVDSDDSRACDKCLEELAEGDLAAWQDDDDLESGPAP